MNILFYVIIGSPALFLFLFVCVKILSKILTTYIDAESVVAGDVRIDNIQAKENTPPFKFSATDFLFQDENGNTLIPNEKQHFIGLVDGKSMQHCGMLNGAVFIADKEAELQVGDIWVLKTPNKEGRHHGMKKLRKIIKINGDVLTTETYDDTINEIRQSEHAKKDRIAKVIYCATIPANVM